MIENSPFTINLARLGGSSGQAESAIDGIRQYTFEDNRGFGFSIENENSDFVSGYLIERDPIKLMEYDASLGSIVETENFQTDLIPFQVDFNNNMLYVFSNQKDLAKVTSRLGEAIRWSFSIDGVTLNLSELYQSLVKNDTLSNLSSVRVKNFQTDTGYGGTFTVKTGLDGDISDFIEHDHGDVVVIRGSVVTPLDEAMVAFYRSGAVRLYNKVEEDNTFWKSMENSIDGAIVE